MASSIHATSHFAVIFEFSAELWTELAGMKILLIAFYTTSKPAQNKVLFSINAVSPLC